MRFVMGPLSWLTHAPILARMPLTPAIGTVAGTMATVATAVATGVIATPPDPVLASNVPALEQSVGKSDPIKEITPENTSVVIGVERVGPGGKVLSLRVLKQPVAGHAHVTAGRQLQFTPSPGFTGTVSVLYEACWPGVTCRRGVVEVVVTPVNDPPVARPDAAVSPGGVPVVVDVLANDVDPEGGPLTIVSVSGTGGNRAQVLERIVLPAGSRAEVARAEIGESGFALHPRAGLSGCRSSPTRSKTRRAGARLRS